MDSDLNSSSNDQILILLLKRIAELEERVRKLETPDRAHGTDPNSLSLLLAG